MKWLVLLTRSPCVGGGLVSSSRTSGISLLTYVHTSSWNVWVSQPIPRTSDLGSGVGVRWAVVLSHLIASYIASASAVSHTYLLTVGPIQSKFSFYHSKISCPGSTDMQSESLLFLKLKVDTAELNGAAGWHACMWLPACGLRLAPPSSSSHSSLDRVSQCVHVKPRATRI